MNQPSGDLRSPKAKVKKSPGTSTHRKKRYDERQKQANGPAPRTRIDFYVSQDDKQAFSELREFLGDGDKPCSKARLLEELVDRTWAHHFSQPNLPDAGHREWYELTARLIDALSQCSSPTPQAIHQVRSVMQDFFPFLLNDD